PPRASISVTVGFGSAMSTTTTRAPSAAAPRQYERPIPLAPPVTMTTLLSSLMAPPCEPSQALALVTASVGGGGKPGITCGGLATTALRGRADARREGRRPRYETRGQQHTAEMFGGRQDLGLIHQLTIDHGHGLLPCRHLAGPAFEEMPGPLVHARGHLVAVQIDVAAQRHLMSLGAASQHRRDEGHADAPAHVSDEIVGGRRVAQALH